MSTQVIKSLFKVLVFFTPLLFVANTYELFEFPKMIFVYALGSTIIWLFAVKKIYLKEPVILPSKIVTLFAIVYFVSTLFSMHFYTSLWGYYSRFNGGFLSLLIFIGLYTVLINEFKSEEIKDLIKTAALTILPVGILTVIQHYEFIANIWNISTTERAIGTLGQPNWLAAYCVMISPTLLGLSFGTFEKYEVGAKNKLGWAFLFFLSFVTMWFAQSLSGIIGFIAAILTFYVLNIQKLNLYIDRFFILMVLCITFALLNPGIFKDRLHDLYIDIMRIVKVYAIDIELQNQYAISDPGFIRQNLWEDTTKLITSSPKVSLIGTGPETFPYAFQKFRSEALNYSSEWNFVFNKPHNYYLELFSNIGILGLACYLFIMVKTISFKNTFYLPGLIGLYVTNFFGWPTVVTTLMFWIFIAGIEKQR